MSGRTYVLRDEGVRQRFKDFIDQLDLSKCWEVSLRPWKAKRTDEQNALFHALIQQIATETGNDPAAVKDYLKTEFGPKRAVKVHGEVRMVPKGSSDYDVGEMSEMIDRARAWAANEYGIFV